MATPTYIPLGTITLGTTTSSVTFSNIPQTYKDLIMVARAKSTSGAYDQAIFFNSESSASTHDCDIMWGDGSTTGVFTSSYIIDFYGSVTTDDTAFTTLHIIDYSATNKEKTYISRAGRTTSGIDMVTGCWANQAAINKIKYFLNGGGIFAVGTTVSLYGVHG